MGSRVVPFEDPEATGSYLMCRFAWRRCPWYARWLPGEEQDARAAKADHEKHCVKKPSPHKRPAVHS